MIRQHVNKHGIPVASAHRLKRVHACNKDLYRTRNEAESWAIYFRYLRGERCYSYQCQLCGGVDTCSGGSIVRLNSSMYIAVRKQSLLKR